MRDLLEYLARALVEDPDAVRVTEVADGDDEVTYEIEVAESDLGRVIGRDGRIAHALRTLARAGSSRSGRRVNVDILD